MDEAIAALLANANYNGETLPASVRVTATDEAHYLDLADPLWSVVKITADGWKWKNPRLVKFCRPHGMQTLPVPRRCGSLEELRPFLNLTSGSDWILLVGWLLMAMNPWAVPHSRIAWVRWLGKEYHQPPIEKSNRCQQRPY
jgi:hypothetical protein